MLKNKLSQNQLRGHATVLGVNSRVMQQCTGSVLPVQHNFFFLVRKCDELAGIMVMTYVM